MSSGMVVVSQDIASGVPEICSLNHTSVGGKRGYEVYENIASLEVLSSHVQTLPGMCYGQVRSSLM